MNTLEKLQELRGKLEGVQCSNVEHDAVRVLRDTLAGAFDLVLEVGRREAIEAAIYEVPPDARARKRGRK